MPLSKSQAHQKYHTATGELVPSVTTVISDNLGRNKRVLMAWARKMALQGKDSDKVRETAADIGTLAHYFIMQHVKSEEPEAAYVQEFSDSDRHMALACFQRYVEWSLSIELEPVSSEISLVDEECKFGGTVDMLARISGTDALVDFKTSNGVYADHLCQVAAYRHMMQHQRGADIPAVYLVRLPKDGADFEIHRYGPAVLDRAYEVFEHLLAINTIWPDVERGV
jgi:hypothetical protein